MTMKIPGSDYLLENLMNNMLDSIYFKDRQSRFVMVNRACADKHGWKSVDDAKGHTDFDDFAKEHADRAFADEQRIIETGEPLFGIEEKETYPDGSVTWASTTKMPLKNDDGEIIGTFGISRDITGHKEAELRAARYDEQVRNIKEQMEENVRIASDLQQTFFPRSYTFFQAAGEGSKSAVQFLHHYHASGIVSGDFCAIRQLSATEAGIFVCDVMGHGVRAALGTALICAMIEESVALENDPGRYLGRMNELLLPILRQEDMFLYVTACCMVFDASSGTLRFANAGHPVPLYFPAGGDSAQWLMDDTSLRGPALAIAEDAEYQTVESIIQPGDTVVMYTDGLYELESPDGEEFGEDRLLEAAIRASGLPLAELFTALIGSAGDFSVEGGFNDDVCLVGFTFHNPM